MTPSLTDAACSVWGKTDRSGRSAVGWLPLWRHLSDTAAVAERLWDEWLGPAVTRSISAGLPGGVDDGRILLTWLAGIHDVGKATPAFAFQAPWLADRMRDRGLGFDHEQVKADRRVAPHATAGQLILTEWLRDRHGWSNGDHYAVVIGGHHGVPPTEQDLLAAQTHPHLLGDSAWSVVQHELLDWMADRTGAGKRLSAWADVALSQPTQALLTGLVIVADWIASNEEFFPYTLSRDESSRAEAAWQALDLPAPWLAVDHPSTVDDLFAARFDLPTGALPRPVQHAVVQQAEQMPLPGMLIVEAAMGEGKTEAALAALEVMARRAEAGGCYIALPTRATSDAMFHRVLGWLRRLPDRDVGRGSRDIMLTHGKAAFNAEYDKLRWRSMPTEIGVDAGGADVGVHRWLAGRKRGMLSSFVVGTIDQLLFAALRSRHLALRHLGLAGKVVIIDEAHAYDVFMGSFLDRALEWLGAYGVPVIVLSATLPAARRAELMQAYDNGRFGPLPKPTWRDRGKPRPDHYKDLRADLRYPLISSSTTERGGTSMGCAASGRGIEVRLARLDDDIAVLAETLRSALTDGGCALVVRNTVARVQETADTLRQMLGENTQVSVAHSRFMALDRAAKDAWLRTTFGPPGAGDRPLRHVVVASQVAEQSLDIDFDLLVTDLAPIDLILQRIGRLHRHGRADRPPLLRSATCYVTGAEWQAMPPAPVAGSKRVYAESVLLRAAAVILPFVEQGRPLRLPDDISPLIQTAYGGDAVGPESWQTAMEAASERAAVIHADKQSRAAGFRLDAVGGPESTLIGWLAGNVGDAEGHQAVGHVRDDNSESLEVIMLIRAEEGLRTPEWIPGGARIVPTESTPSAQLARVVAGCTLLLPPAMTAPDVVGDVIAELERRNSFPAWSQSPWLEGELVLDFDSDGCARVGSFDLQYDIHDGLRVSRVG